MDETLNPADWGAVPVGRAPLQITVGGPQATDNDPSSWGAVKVSPAVKGVQEFMNIGPAASQGTTRFIEPHKKNLVSADVHESDAGEILYRDPTTGELVPTDRTKQVAIRDPADRNVKVFSRSPGTEDWKVPIPGTDSAVNLGSAANVLSSGLASGAPTSRAVVGQGAPSIQHLKDAAKAGFQSEAVTGLAMRAPALSTWAEGTAAKLNQMGFDENVTPTTFALLRKAIAAPEGAFVTGNNIKSLRETLGNAANPVNPKEAMAASLAIEHLDDFVQNVPRASLLSGDGKAAAETWRQARGDYSAAKSAERFDRKIYQAETSADAANSGMNLGNRIRQRTASVLTPESAAARRGYRPEELKAMEGIVQGTRAGNAARTAGDILGGGGGLASVANASIGGAIGLATGGPMGAAIGAVTQPGLGFLLRTISNKMTASQADKLSGMIRSRAPLAKAMESSSTKLTDKWEQFSQRPSYEHYATLTVAARNLANTLKGAGLEFSPREILRALQTPVRANPGDEKQQP